MVASGEELLLAGFPNYVWPSTPGSLEAPARDSILGVVLAPGRRPRVVPKPRDLWAGDVVAAAHPDGGWWIALAEVDVPAWRGDAPPPKAYWIGRFDGEWTQLQRLPFPPGYRADLSRHAELSATPGSALLALLLGPAGRIMTYQVSASGWMAERVALPSARGGEFTSPTDLIAFDLLPATDGGPRVVGNGGDTTRLYLRTSQWNEQTLFVDTLSEWISDFQALSSLPSAVSWVDADRREVVAYTGSLEAPPLERLVVDRGAADVQRLVLSALSAPDGAPLWIVEHRHRSGGKLRLLHLVDDSVRSVASAPSPFHLQFERAARVGQDRLVLAGAHVIQASEDSLLATLLVETRVDCSEPPSRPLRALGLLLRASPVPAQVAPQAPVDVVLPEALPPGWLKGFQQPVALGAVIVTPDGSDRIVLAPEHATPETLDHALARLHDLRQRGAGARRPVLVVLGAARRAPSSAGRPGLAQALEQARRRPPVEVPGIGRARVLRFQP